MKMKYLILLLLIFMCFLSLLGCSTAYHYEGYVKDFETKKPIQNATFKFNKSGNTEIVKTDADGFFELAGRSYHCYMDWNVKDVTAGDYGILQSWTLKNDESVTIYLMPSNTIYGTCYSDRDEEKEVLLKGETFERTAECNKNGEFYFSDVPKGEAMTMIVYNKNDFDILYDYYEIESETLNDYDLLYRAIYDDKRY